MAIQQNNGGPVGYGQPGKGNGMRRSLMRPEDEQLFGGQSPETEDVRQDPTLGQGQPPNVYPQQPPGIPGGWRNQSMPGRTPMTGAGENQYAQQSYQTRTDDPFVAGIRNQMATPMGASQRPGTGGSADPRVADPSSGFGYGGVQNPQYGGQQGGMPPAWTQRNGGFNPQSGQQGQPQEQGQYGGLQAAAQQSMQGFTDIAGMRDTFKPGQFMGQLEGFNTNSWGTGERGSDTLKNMFGTIASNHDVSQPGALQRALVDIQKALPNASIVSHANEDLLDPDGPNGPLQRVDVIRGATAGGAGAAWQWGPLDQQGAPNAGMSGPQGPSNQVYNSAITQMTPQAGGVGPDGAPEVQDPNSAMKFLEWLMQQQQQGQIGQAPSMPFV